MHPLTLLAIILPAAGLIVGWKVGLRRWTRRARTAADAEQVVTEILRKETPALTRADVQAWVGVEPFFTIGRWLGGDRGARIEVELRPRGAAKGVAGS